MITNTRRIGQPEVIITSDEYAKFCEYFYHKTGILFTEKKAYFVERRLTDCMERIGSTSFREYFSLLRFELSGAEWQQLVNELTVNETYFLREDYQFDALVRGMLPEIVKGRDRGATVRIWSLPCSTGEEPYSIAIHILENWARSDDFAIEISASDIDSRVIATAIEGTYAERSLHRLSPGLRRKYFSKISSDQFQLRDEIRQSIQFSACNAVDPLSMSKYRSIDVIFCRNLLIYFDDTSRRESVDLMYECLRPGGFICLGHAESMSKISSLFKPRKFGDTIVYQKVS
ncbi:MAG: protein-glutamate O-methyltransferase CheR [Ancalomicrobiaceae bacterium]|nr:protein-glutamate O-methyltransferase CheR [Ancalomicrobiaceae bacterium]